MKNIVIIGFMASGKTTIGEKLAEKTNLPFVDTDKKIEEQENLTIVEIFEQYGENHFRTLETQMVKDMTRENGQVISTGGGIILNPLNMKLFRKNGIIVYLHAGIDTILKNISGTSRPNANGKSPQELATVLKQREPLYEQCDIKIDTSNKSVNTIVNELYDKIQKKTQINI